MILSAPECEAFLNNDQSIQSIYKLRQGYLLTTEYQQVVVEVAHASVGVGPSKLNMIWSVPDQLNHIPHSGHPDPKLLLLIEEHLFAKHGAADFLESLVHTPDGYRITTFKGKSFILN